jgi:hypothetical protein
VPILSDELTAVPTAAVLSVEEAFVHGLVSTIVGCRAAEGVGDDDKARLTVGALVGLFGFLVELNLSMNFPSLLDLTIQLISGITYFFSLLSFCSTPLRAAVALVARMRGL